MNLFFQSEFVKYGPASQPYHKDFSTLDTHGTHLPFPRKKGPRPKAVIPFIIEMVPKAGFEPARVFFYLGNGGIGIRTMLWTFTCPAHWLITFGANCFQ